MDYNNKFVDACRKGKIDEVSLIISENYSGIDFDNGLSEACFMNHIEIVKLLLDKQVVKDITWGLCNACFRGYKEIVELLLTDRTYKNSYTDKHMMNMGMINACKKGSLEIVELMIKEGADNWQDSLNSACYNGHLEIVNFMLGKGANEFDEGLYDACSNNKKEIAFLMIILGANINNFFISETSRLHIYNSLNFDDIYYLYLNKLKHFGKYSDIAHYCQKWKIEFSNVSNELFIKDIANLLIEF